MFQLQFENHTFHKIEDFEQASIDLHDAIKTAINFCRDWLGGNSTFIQQTSGSTGLPKKIEIRRQQMLSSAQATGTFFRTNSETQLLCCLNPEYIAGKMMLVRAMVWDCPIRVVEPVANPFSKLSANISPDFVAMVPLQVEACLTDPKALITLRKISNLIIGGAAISEKLKRSLLENQIQAWQTYGMTETVSHIALAKIEITELHYQTLPGVKIGQDSRGALWVKSPMSGPGEIQTNDLVTLTSSNSFHWLGRADFVINSGGHKIHPELLEQRAESLIQEFFPDCRFFFFGEKEDKLGERLVLILEKNDPNEEVAKLLQAKLRSFLGNFETPKNIYFIPHFIETASGKINRLMTFQKL